MQNNGVDDFPPVFSDRGEVVDRKGWVHRCDRDGRYIETCSG